MLALPWRLGTAAIVHARSCTLNGCVHTCLDANARASGPSTRVSHSNKALRDIVQFVDFSCDPDRLARETLREVLTAAFIENLNLINRSLHRSIALQLPNQVLEYMKYKKFKPPGCDVDLHAPPDTPGVRKQPDIEDHAAEAAKVSHNGT